MTRLKDAELSVSRQRPVAVALLVAGAFFMENLDGTVIATVSAGVAHDAADYARKVVRLGTDPAFRASVRAAIFARNSVLYDNPGFVRELEEFFPRALAQHGRRAA